jgi:hypothetical protein
MLSKRRREKGLAVLLLSYPKPVTPKKKKKIILLYLFHIESLRIAIILS